MFGADPTFGVRSADALRSSIASGSLIACDVVWAEVATGFDQDAEVLAAMQQLGVAFSPLAIDAALTAGRRFQDYQRHGGRRDRVIADFLIGAHARTSADRLLTRDRGFYRRYFADLVIVDPSISARR